MPKSAGARWRRSKSTGTCMSELARQIERYLEEADACRLLRRTRVARLCFRSADSFCISSRRRSWKPPAPRAIDLLLLREWLVALVPAKS